MCSTKCISCDLPLCLKTLMVAPDNLAPVIREAWFSWSLIMRDPCNYVRCIDIEVSDIISSTGGITICILEAAVETWNNTIHH